MASNTMTGEFVYSTPETAARGSVLYEQHLRLVPKSRLAPFAGYLMPLWYTSIAAEHEAVRRRAGMFDCTHMGALEVTGQGAEAFLNETTTNDLRLLKSGGAQYGYVLDASGGVLDDIIVYRRGPDRFMVIVNAANEGKIKAYLDAVLGGRAVLDIRDKNKKVVSKPGICDMRDTASRGDHRCDIAVQGPASARVIAMLADKDEAAAIGQLRPFTFIECAVAGTDCIVARTGYTGAKTGFELFVSPDKAPQLWDILLERGSGEGLIPCGLGSRDSLRVEAGLPLYGHELDGEFGITPFEAGYGWAVKTEKGFFVGREAMVTVASGYARQVVRLALPGEAGIRPVRMHDGVLDAGGKCVGAVLSCAKAGDRQIALALVTKDSLVEADSIGVYYAARNARQVEEGRKEKVAIGQKLQADLAGTVLNRFEKF
jgi:glycine cleavage system T protein